MTDLATALLRDVRRHEPDNPLDSAPSMKDDPQGDWLSRDEVLAALSRALDPAIAERAREVLEGGEFDPVSMYEEALGFANGTKVPAKWALWAHSDLVRSRTLITALIAQNAALRAERDALAERNKENSRLAEENAQGLREAEAKVKKLRGERDDALTFLDNAVSKAPEPLKALGKYLAGRLDEDEWPTAEQHLNAAAKACADRTTAAEAEVEKLRGALHNCVGMLDCLVAESGRSIEWDQEDPFRMGEWFEPDDLKQLAQARVALSTTTEEGHE